MPRLRNIPIFVYTQAIHFFGAALIIVCGPTVNAQPINNTSQEQLSNLIDWVKKGNYSAIEANALDINNSYAVKPSFCNYGNCGGKKYRYQFE